jgi:hypothetical protein
MVRYISRLEAKKHAIRSGMVSSFKEFDERFPEKDYVCVWGRYTPTMRRRFKVKVIPDEKMGQYDGMNHPAAKELHFSPVPKKDEVYVSDSVKGLYKKQVIVHEKIEQWHMENRGLKYKKAHAIAEQFDKNIKR